MRRIAFSPVQSVGLPKVRNNFGTFLLRETSTIVSTKPNFFHSYREENVNPWFAQKISRKHEPTRNLIDTNKKAKAEELLKEFAVDMELLPVLNQEEIFKNACHKSMPDEVPYIAGKLLSVCANISVNEIYEWIIEINKPEAIGSLLSSDYFKSFMCDASKGKIKFQELAMKAIDENNNVLDYLLKYSDIILKILDENLNTKSSKAEEFLAIMLRAIEKKNETAINLLLQYDFFEVDQKQAAIAYAEKLYGQDHRIVKILCDEALLSCRI